MPALQNDLTQGSVSRKLIRYAMPLVASSLLQAIYSITDIIIAGHFIGDVGISAINTSSVIMNMLTQLAIGLTVGGNILVGRYFGSGDEEERKKAEAWIDMGFDDQVIRLAYEKTVYKKQKMDWDYMNGILCGWHKKNLHTLAEIEAGDAPRRRSAGPAMQDHPARPGDADRRVREDVARMREFLRRQNEEGG